tara:strand:- start:2212 stop:3897 length:1686 start_codon:yes stop_codon:yes gene_type:complete
MKKIFLLLISINVFSQNISLNEDFLLDKLRISQINGDVNSPISFNIRPIDLKSYSDDFENLQIKSYYPVLKKKILSNLEIKFLPINNTIEFNSHHPYNRNNGSLIPNRGIQNRISFGLYGKIGPLSFQFNPEHLYSENKSYEGFWKDHYPVIWSRRYNLWNHIDIPEVFGKKRHNKILIGQSNIKFNFKGISLGVSNENLWWGPSIRNSIMMSNHARGFKHITLNSYKPLKSAIGWFEFQLVSGRLESSKYTPPNPEFTYAGRKLYVPKTNQIPEIDDWRYFQGLVISYTPKFYKNISIGLIRWVQMYSAQVEGRYYWMIGKPTYFPVFKNLFRKNDAYENYEAQTDQAGGVFFRWLWPEAKSEIYSEFHLNDTRQNIRDLLLDSDHSRAITIGLRKLFNQKKGKLLFDWEWTKLERTQGRVLRKANSWYTHEWVRHGYTNYGEVIGAGIGPGSNSNYFSIKKITNEKIFGLAFEIIDQDNDFFYDAFDSANDYRRYWKDFNLHINFEKDYNKFMISSNLVYSRSLNYQWQLDDTIQPYYHAGKDVNNFHLTFKILYKLVD